VITIQPLETQTQILIHTLMCADGKCHDSHLVLQHFICMHVTSNIKMEINTFVILADTHHQTVCSTVRNPPQ